MSIDGITLHAIADELNNVLAGSHIKKIAQPEKEEILLTCSKERQTHRLLLSSLPSLPVVYLTQENKESPMTAPNFCMCLRKYLSGGRITSIVQIDFERVLDIEIEHLNELGDPAKKHLYVEIMGKYSNIILCDENKRIIDSIRHVPASMSSIREVLPGREYFIPKQEGRYGIFTFTEEEFYSDILKRPLPLKKMILNTFLGFGPVISEELCCRLDIDSDASVLSLSKWQQEAFYALLLKLKDALLQNAYHPCVILEPGSKKPIEVYPFLLSHYGDKETLSFSSISDALCAFYSAKNKKNNMEQRTADLRKQLNTLKERNIKKLDLQNKQMKDTDSMEKYRLYGELLAANAYWIDDGAKKATVENYYTNETIDIPLDPMLSAMENSNKYYAKYNKQKRTKEALLLQVEETKKAIQHLETILSAASLAENEADIAALRQELFEYGFTKKRPEAKKGNQKKSKPLHFISEDGYEFYVGKNNYQNEEVTFKIAQGNDWWFHSKTIPGSHIIVKTKDGELPDHIFEMAASLAAYYSTGREQEKVEIDYIQKKQVKKVAGAAPGYVIYHTNYSMTVRPSIEGLREM